MVTIYNHLLLTYVYTQALISARLDNLITAPLSAVFVPLHVAIVILIITTVTRDPANPWWFGLRKNLTEVVLDSVPLVREYANISHIRGYEGDSDSNQEMAEMHPVNYEDLLSVSNPATIVRWRNVLSKAAISDGSKFEFVDDTFYPYENLYEPD